MGKSLKGKELGKGVSQRKDGLYYARFINRFGKRQTVYGKTVSEVNKRKLEAVIEDEKKLNVVDEKMTLDEWFDTWITIHKAHCRDTTKHTYTVQYNRLREELGWRRLSSLNQTIIQKAISALSSKSMREDSKAVLVDMLNTAVGADLITKNYALMVKTKMAEDDVDDVGGKRILSAEEQKVLLETATKTGNMYRIILLALNTGMRIGEILGLCWDCVDLENNVIHIKRQLCYLPNYGKARYEFHKPKTKAGFRDIPMRKSVKIMFLEQKMHCNLINSRHPATHGFEDLVFTSKTNKPINEANVREAIRYYVDKIRKEYPEMDFKPFTPHCLRHTFATDCIESGMSPKTLQEIMGHTSLKMTMDLYTHVRKDTKREEMGLIAEMA